MRFLYNKHALQILAIFLLALFLRLYRIDELMRFIWDEGRDMLAIRSIIVDRNLTLFGPFNEIAGQIDFFGVFHYYLMLPSLFFANLYPIGPAIFTAILGACTIPLFYLFLKRFATHQSSVIATLLLAISPLVVNYTRWPWNPNTTGFFAILYLLVLQKYTTHKNQITYAFIAGLLLGLLFQLHYFTIALTAAALLTFYQQPTRKYQSALLFIFGFVLPNLSFVVFDLTHEYFYSKIMLASFFGSTSQQFIEFSFTSILSPIKYLFEIGGAFLGWPITGGVIMLFSFSLYTISKIKTGSLEEKQLLYSWITFLLLTSFFPKLLNQHHSAALWFGLAMNMAWLIQKIPYKSLQIAVLAILICTMLINNNLFSKPQWDQNMPRTREVGNLIAQDSLQHGEQKINVASLIDADARATRFRYFIIRYGQDLLGIDQYDHSQTLYVISPVQTTEEMLRNPAWEISSFKPYPFEQLWTDGDWILWKSTKATAAN